MADDPEEQERKRKQALEAINNMDVEDCKPHSEGDKKEKEKPPEEKEQKEEKKEEKKEERKPDDEMKSKEQPKEPEKEKEKEQKEEDGKSKEQSVASKEQPKEEKQEGERDNSEQRRKKDESEQRRKKKASKENEEKGEEKEKEKPGSSELRRMKQREAEEERKEEEKMEQEQKEQKMDESRKRRKKKRKKEKEKEKEKDREKPKDEKEKEQDKENEKEKKASKEKSERKEEKSHKEEKKPEKWEPVEEEALDKTEGSERRKVDRSGRDEPEKSAADTSATRKKKGDKSTRREDLSKSSSRRRRPTKTSREKTFTSSKQKKAKSVREEEAVVTEKLDKEEREKAPRTDASETKRKRRKDVVEKTEDDVEKTCEGKDDKDYDRAFFGVDAATEAEKKNDAAKSKVTEGCAADYVKLEDAMGTVPAPKKPQEGKILDRLEKTDQRDCKKKKVFSKIFQQKSWDGSNKKKKREKKEKEVKQKKGSFIVKEGDASASRKKRKTKFGMDDVKEIKNDADKLKEKDPIGASNKSAPRRKKTDSGKKRKEREDHSKQDFSLFFERLKKRKNSKITTRLPEGHDSFPEGAVSTKSMSDSDSVTITPEAQAELDRIFAVNKDTGKSCMKNMIVMGSSEPEYYKESEQRADAHRIIRNNGGKLHNNYIPFWCNANPSSPNTPSKEDKSDITREDLRLTVAVFSKILAKETTLFDAPPEPPHDPDAEFKTLVSVDESHFGCNVLFGNTVRTMVNAGNNVQTRFQEKMAKKMRGQQNRAGSKKRRFKLVKNTQKLSITLPKEQVRYYTDAVREQRSEKLPDLITRKITSFVNFGRATPVKALPLPPPKPTPPASPQLSDPTKSPQNKSPAASSPRATSPK